MHAEQLFCSACKGFLRRPLDPESCCMTPKRKDAHMKATHQHFKRYTKEEIERYLTPAGGYLRKDIEAMGVNWPPMKGWKDRLLRGEDPNQGRPLRKGKPGKPGPTKAELVATITRQEAEIDRLLLELEEAKLCAAWQSRIA